MPTGAINNSDERNFEINLVDVTRVEPINSPILSCVSLKGNSHHWPHLLPSRFTNIDNSACNLCSALPRCLILRSWRVHSLTASKPIFSSIFTLLWKDKSVKASTQTPSLHRRSVLNWSPDCKKASEEQFEEASFYRDELSFLSNNYYFNSNNNINISKN